MLPAYVRPHVKRHKKDATDAEAICEGLFTAGALAVIRYAKIHGTGHRPWLTALLARRPTKVAAIVLANKTHGIEHRATADCDGK